MEISLREWLIIGGILVIALILFDGWRRIRGNRNRIRMDLEPTAADDADEEALRQHNPELPNGGARRCGESTELEPAAAPAKAAPAERVEPSFSPPPEPKAKVRAPVAEHEPVVEKKSKSDRGASRVSTEQEQSPLAHMDPLFDDVPVEPAGSQRRAPEVSRASTSEPDDDLTSAIEQGEIDSLSLAMDDRHHEEPSDNRDAAGDEPDQLADKEMPALRAERDEPPFEPASMSLDFDLEQPIPVLMDRVRQGGEPRRKRRKAEGNPNGELPLEPAQNSEPAPAHRAAEPVDPELDSLEGLSLDVDEEAPERVERKPTADRTMTAEAPSSSRREPRTEPHQDRPKPDISVDPEEMLVIFVVADTANPLPGAAVQRIAEACGMEFGEMQIFHRYEEPRDGGALQFSMANAVNPGTFDLDTMAESSTPAVSFFMSMRDPSDPLTAYECMLATAETLAKHLDAELLDGDRSVMRPQTKEHYRERIRDFEIHKRVKRSL